jgi:hypothetical protein
MLVDFIYHFAGDDGGRTLLKKLIRILGLGSGAENGLSRDLATAFRKVYLAQMRLATQIKAHADLAPYPHVAQQLNHVADEKLRSCEVLRDALSKLGSYVSKDVPGEIYSGGNHWERMARDLRDQSALEQTLSELSRLVHEAPEESEFLSRMIVGERSHREVLTDLLMRADPQAHQI